jgi:ATP-dependent Clp endopeptidase proteolytic subunit ClpP
MVKSWYSVQNALAADDGPAEILIYDEISPVWGVSAADFVKDLAQIDAPDITVRINSPGGSVFDGIAILNALRGHPAQITTVVDSLAASIASVIAMGGDKVVMNKNSTMMVHNAWDIVAGNADELQKAADTLRSFSSNLASVYAEKAGGTVEDWQAVMDAETWYTADEAVAAGLADEVVSQPDKQMSYARASFDLSKFKHAGRAAAPAPVIVARNQTPPPVEVEDPQGKDATVATLNEMLGLDADADEAAIAAKVGELVEAAKETEPAPVVEPTHDQITAAAAKANMSVVPTARLTEMESTLASLQSARAAQLKAEDERVVDDAIKRGKFGPASKAAFMKLMDVDRDSTRADIAGIPDGLIPVAEMGHSAVGGEQDQADPELSNAYAKIVGRAFAGEDA